MTPWDGVRTELRPNMQAGSVLVPLDRYREDECRGQDPGKTSSDIQRYLQNFRLLADERGPGLVASDGVWHPLPSATRQVVLREIEDSLGGLLVYFKYIVFCDDQAHALLRMAPYGWDENELGQFLRARGWHADLTMKHLAGPSAVEDEFKDRSYRSAPVAGVARYWEPLPVKQRLRRALHRFGHHDEPVAG